MGGRVALEVMRLSFAYRLPRQRKWRCVQKNCVNANSCWILRAPKVCAQWPWIKPMVAPSRFDPAFVEEIAMICRKSEDTFKAKLKRYWAK
jgi:hypothetical protein